MSAMTKQEIEGKKLNSPSPLLIDKDSESALLSRSKVPDSPS